MQIQHLYNTYLLLADPLAHDDRCLEHIYNSHKERQD